MNELIDELAAPEPSQAPPPAEGPPSTRELRLQALTAVHDGQYRQATRLLAQALAQTDPTEQASADILLELARIHLRDLDEPAQAAHYLNRFLDQWPQDPAAAAIRDQLCTIGGVPESDSEICVQ